MARITPLTPKQIRHEIRDLLVARLPASVPGVSVFAGRARPFQKDELPAVNVFSPGSEASGRSIHIADLKTVDRLHVVAACRLPSGGGFDGRDEALADLVDDIEEAIKIAILTSRVVIATFERVDGMTTRKGLDAIEGEDWQGYVEIDFRFRRAECYAPAADPGTPDPDLDTVNVVSLFGEVLADESGAVLVTEEGAALLVAGADNRFTVDGLAS